MENVGLQSLEPIPLHAAREKEGDRVGSGRDVNRLYRAVGSFQTRPVVQTLLRLHKWRQLSSKFVLFRGPLSCRHTPPGVPFLSLLLSRFDFLPPALLEDC